VIGPAAAPRDRSEIASVCLSVAAVNRVTSIVPIFFGRLDGLRASDTVDVKQGVELVWRELTGQTRADALRREILSQLPDFGRRAIESGTRGATAVVSALDAIGVLLEEFTDSRGHLRRALSAALDVALEFDTLAVVAPAEQPSWATFELRGQAALFELVPVSANQVSPDQLSELRMTSGAASMDYRNAMKSLLSAR
jgi:hypothetical protein